MVTVNQQLADESVAHAVSLDQYKAGVVRRIIALLNRSDSQLVEELDKALERLSPESFTVERLELVLKQVRDINADAYAQVSQALQGDLTDFADYETSWQQKLIETAVPEPVLIRFPLVRLSAEQLYAAAMARPFQGRLLRNWASTIEADRMVKIRNAVSTGYLEGKTTDQIIRTVRGTKANAYADGFLERPRQDLATVVRSAISHTAAVAREQLYEANSDILAAEDWTSTLDTKTSAPCRIRDKKPYEVGTHKPIGHSVPWLQGPGRLHFNCRSTSSPRTRSWRELGIPVDEITAKQRASMDGAVPADMDYGQWLLRQSDDRKLQVLGQARFQLYKEGRDLDTFYKPNGEFLTLEQLKARDAKFKQPTGEFTVFDTGYPSTRPDVSTASRRAAVQVEENIRKDKLETGAFIDKNGAVVLQRQGEPDHVGFYPDELSRMKGTTFTHNHPGNTTFSAEDISLAAATGLYELRAVGPTLRYTMVAENGWPDHATMEAAIKESMVVAQKRVDSMAGRGELENEHRQSEAEHQVWVAFSAALKLKYGREKS